MDKKNLLVKTLEFWTGFYFEGYYDCFTWAVEKAYPDMARHTMNYNKTVDNKNRRIADFQFALKDKVINMLRNGELIYAFSAHNNKVGIKELYSEKLISVRDFANSIDNQLINSFTIGHAQKLLNMSMKYLWLLYNTFCMDENILKEINDIYKEKVHDSKIMNLKKLYDNVDALHIPLDSFILSEINKLAKEDKKEMIAWSKIDEPEEYKRYQEYCKKIAKEKDKLPPLYWELCNWNFIKERTDKNMEVLQWR